jgi:tryptophanyl-tRNA synthetase
LGDHLGILLQAIDRLAVVPVAIDADQHLRLDLAEAVEHALHAEIRRGG